MERNGTDLLPTECWELLASTSVGRLALSIRALPLILPVHYVVDGRSVNISLGTNCLPSASINNAVVAFAVDEFDLSVGSGWMVHLQGRSHLAPSTDLNCGHLPTGDVSVLRITPGTVSGTRLTFQQSSAFP